MSSQRGNVKKTGPPKHRNKSAFKNNLHDKSKKTQIMNSMETWGLCTTCKGVIDWKIKYKKYKPLTQPKTCVKCSQKTIKRAYYTVCNPCAEKFKVCGKCAKEKDIVQVVGLSPEEEASQQVQLDAELKNLSERQRRSFFRNQASGKREGAEAAGGEAPGEESEDSNSEEQDEESESEDVGESTVKQTRAEDEEKTTDQLETLSLDK